METEEIKNNSPEADKFKNSVHEVLAHSYFVYFLLFLLGIFLDLVFHFKTFNSYIMIPIGSILIFFASLLIFWAQITTQNLTKETLTKETFFQGPYKFTRIPTHIGLFILMLGFGILINATFIVIFSIIFFIFNKIIFLRKEEKILEEKYGAPYIEYKKLVRF